MASWDVECAFVGRFWYATERRSEEDHAMAWEAASQVHPEYLEHKPLRVLYDVLQLRFAEGDPNDPALLMPTLEHPNNAVPREVIGQVLDEAIHPGALPRLAREVVQDWQRREFIGLCSAAAEKLRNGGGKDGGHAVAEDLQLELLRLYSSTGQGPSLKSKAQLIDEGIARALSTTPRGLTVPWPKLHNECGPWIPGELIGVCGFSNSGKSTLAANLFFAFARRGVPVIAFPTEMREQWLDRAVCALAGVEQWRAEKGQWRDAEDQRERFIAAWEHTRKWEWIAVNRPDISPQQIAQATRILRRRWAGQTVLVIVDHMHRLDYGKEDPDDAAGPATKFFKNLSGSDDQGGLVMLLLYQARKPMDEQHRPVPPQEIRGHGMHWNELDVYFSPFRAFVKTVPGLRTPWGTPKAMKGPRGPVWANRKKDDPDTYKLDDEHTYVKVYKRRVGGEGRTLWLNIDGPTGRIYEIEEYRDDEYR